jgi:hypothetical protein
LPSGTTPLNKTKLTLSNRLQENPAQFQPKPDASGVLVEKKSVEKKRKKRSVVSNADIITDIDGEKDRLDQGVDVVIAILANF